MTALVIGVVALAVGVLVGFALARQGTRGAAAAHEADPGDVRFRRAVERLGAVFATRDREAIAEVVLETAAIAVAADAAVLYAVTPGAPLTARVVHGAASRETEVAFGAGVAGTAAAADDAVRWPGASAPAPAAGEPDASSAAAVPLHAGERLGGVVAVYRRGDRPALSHADVATVVTVVRQAEAAIDNLLLHEEAERLSITDGLTGVWNRRHLDLRASEELRRARRFSEPFSLVLVDVDDFKRINDTHGHQAGDAVLVDLAGRLASSVREVDTVARYGGEEFCLLLPRTDVEGAHRLAEKVRDAIAAAPFVVDGASLTVTASLGVATHPAHGDTVASLIAAVDAALYRAKRGGKNRVERAAASVEGRTG